MTAPTRIVSRDPRRWPLAEFLTILYVVLGFIVLFAAAGGGAS